jgi:DNA-binding transcriptional LysR family regulator
MDRLDAMRLYTRIVDRGSFTLAALDLEVPRSTATQVIKELEVRLGVRLLQRTTRSVRSTLDGEAYYQRCVAILGEVEDAESAFRDTKPRGLLRVDVHGTLARHFVLPALPVFLAEYPDLQLQMSEGDRLVDLVREGIDCVLRVGDLQDGAMIARSRDADGSHVRKSYVPGPLRCPRNARGSRGTRRGSLHVLRHGRSDAAGIYRRRCSKESETPGHRDGRCG